MQDGVPSSLRTTAITLRRSVADSSPSLSSFASPAAPPPAAAPAPPPARPPPTPAPGRAAPPAAAAAAAPALLPPPPSQLRNVEHLYFEHDLERRPGRASA